MPAAFQNFFFYVSDLKIINADFSLFEIDSVGAQKRQIKIELFEHFDRQRSVGHIPVHAEFAAQQIHRSGEGGGQLLQEKCVWVLEMDS